MARHDAIRDAIQQWLRKHGVNALTEQHVPKWDTPTERAILDVTYVDPQEGLTCVDVSVVATSAEDAVGAGLLLARRERSKHIRYAREGLSPFVIDARGRWGVEAQSWARGVLRQKDARERGSAMAELR